MTAIRHRVELQRPRPAPAPTAERLGAVSKPRVVDPAPVHRSIAWGVVWMVCAGVATLLTSLVADDLGADGLYLFWWGPLAYGALMVVLGLRDLRTIREGSVPERFVP